MSTITLTFIISAIILIIAMGILAIGWLVKGKSILRPGACGRNPHQKKQDSCGKETSCHLCEHEQKK